MLAGIPGMPGIAACARAAACVPAGAAAGERNLFPLPRFEDVASAHAEVTLLDAPHCRGCDPLPASPARHLFFASSNLPIIRWRIPATRAYGNPRGLPECAAGRSRLRRPCRRRCWIAATFRPHPQLDENVRRHVQGVGRRGRDIRVGASRRQGQDGVVGIIERMDDEVRRRRDAWGFSAKTFRAMDAASA